MRQKHERAPRPRRLPSPSSSHSVCLRRLPPSLLGRCSGGGGPLIGEAKRERICKSAACVLRPGTTVLILYRLVHKKRTVLLSISLAWPAVAGCSQAETFSQLSAISFAQPCTVCGRMSQLICAISLAGRIRSCHEINIKMENVSFVKRVLL